MIAALALARCCIPAVHEQMKADPVLFLRCAFRGILHLGQCDPLMLRQCDCGLTLAVPMSRVVVMYPEARWAL